MRKTFPAIFFFLSLVWISTLHAQPQEANNTRVAAAPNKILPADVRVLIDISGSMKQTDPQNLRKPALDLIVRLLPDNSRAGVWNFGNAVNMLMPFKPVDAQWRTQAAAKTSAINSVAMYTNIGKALDEVSFDKQALSPDYNTHIVLLTDGVVDISKDAVANANERQRILNEILPSLKTAGYKIHTIALSEKSDTELLKKLSQSTDGIYTLAASADQLMAVFLKIFDQAVPAERLPLENNSFLVDASVKEFTALIFRNVGVDKTIISAPDGKDYHAANSSDGISWYRTDKYDLVTVANPKTGQWKIKTEIAPQSRITIVSNLQLVVEPLKNNLHTNAAMPLSYSFQENGKVITDANFLRLIDVSAVVTNIASKENTKITFAPSALPADGLFQQTLTAFGAASDYEIHLLVDGKTFKREFKHSLNVRDSLMQLEKNSLTTSDGKVHYNYKVTTDPKVVDFAKTQLSATISSSSPSSSPSHKALEQKLIAVDGQAWELSFVPEAAGDYAVVIHAQGELLSGERLDETLAADNFTYTPPLPEVAAPAISHAEPPALETPANETKQTSNLLLYIAIGVGAVLLLLLGFVAYKFWVIGKVKRASVAVEKKSSAASTKKKDETETKVAANDFSEPEVDTKKTAEKTEIDLSDDSMHIPIAEETGLDDLFPLDSMEDANGPDDRN